MKRSFLTGLGLALLLALGMRAPVGAQLPSILFGSNSGTAVPVKVNSAGAVSVSATTSSGATLGGVLVTDTTSTCTVANTTETDLWTYTLPANSLNADGRGLRITVVGVFGATANTKNVRPYFAGTALQTFTTTNNAGAWKTTAEVLRTGASAQYGFVTTQANTSGVVMTSGTAAGDTTGAITIKVTGQNGTSAANDICVKGAWVETLK